MASRYSAEILVVITADDWDVAPEVDIIRAALYGGMYEDTTTASGSVHYPGLIKSDITLDKKIGVSFWDEASEIDFGYLDLALENQNLTLIDFAKNVTVATVDIYRVNIGDPLQAELELLASARSSDIGFVNEFTVRLRLESVLQGGFDAPINSLYYDSTYPHLEGKPYPIAWGLITDVEQLLPTLFVDAVYLLYHVTDLTINSFETDVYDRGVALGASSEFTPDTYGFVLNQNPDGKITCGRILLQDPYDSGDLLGLYRIVRLVMTRAGLWSNVDTAELANLQTQIGMGDAYPQYFTQQVVSTQRFLDDIFTATGAWYYVDELAEIHFGRLINPDAQVPIYVFTDTNTRGTIKVEDDKAPGLTTRIDHGENPGAYDHDELAGAVTNDDRLAMTNPIYTNETTQPVISFYEKAAARDPAKLALSYGESIQAGALWTADATFTIDSTSYTADGFTPGFGVKTSGEIALFEVNRWWSDLYPQRRRFYTFDVSLNDTQFDDSPLPQLGQICSLQSDRFKLLDTAKNLIIRRVRFNFSANLLTIEAWG